MSIVGEQRICSLYSFKNQGYQGLSWIQLVMVTNEEELSGMSHRGWWILNQKDTFFPLPTPCLDPVTWAHGEENDNPLQYFCLENPMDRGSWWAAVYRFTKSRTWLKQLSMRACIGEGTGNPLQCSCLENPRDRGAWWAAVCGVAQSRTRLKRLSSSSSTWGSWE